MGSFRIFRTESDGARRRLSDLELRHKTETTRAPFLTGARVWRLRRRNPCLVVRPGDDPREEEIVRLLVGGDAIAPRRLCSSCRRQFSHFRVGLEPGWSMVPCGTASGEPVNMTEQKPALDSAGQPGPVASGLASSASSLFGIYPGDLVDSRALSD